MLTSPELAQLVALGTLGAFASYSDLRFRRLPNLLALVTFVAGLVASGGLSGWPGLLSALGHAAIALVLGMLLFRAGAIGGGDAKFYAGVAAWFTLRDGLFVFVTVALVGLVLVLGWFAVLRLANKWRSPRERNDAFGKLPYGIAIALGGWLSALLLALRS